MTVTGDTQMNDIVPDLEELMINSKTTIQCSVTVLVHLFTQSEWQCNVIKEDRLEKGVVNLF